MLVMLWYSILMEKLPLRIQSKIRIVNGCWLWVAAKNAHGYGRVRWDGKGRKAHRVVYSILIGDPGKELDHLCRTRSCVNPDHLEPVTHAENVRRGNSAQALSEKYAQPRNCPNGHPMQGENLRVYVKSDGCLNRRCRTCSAENTRRYRLRQKSVIS